MKFVSGKKTLCLIAFAVLTVLMLCGSYRLRSVGIGGRQYFRGADLAVRYGMRPLRRSGKSSVEYGGRLNSLYLEQAEF